MATTWLRPPAVLRDEPQFRLLFAGQLLSILGDRVMFVVLPFAVLAVGGGVTDVALVAAAQFLPFAVLALPAGVWADRMDRRRILIVSDTVRLLCQCVGGLLLFSGAADVLHLGVLAAVYGAADAFFAPAFTGLMPATVAFSNLQPANALRGLSFSFGAVAGPLLGGVLVGVGGAGGAFLFDAATFAVSIACLLRMRGRQPATVPEPHIPDAKPGRFARDLRQGWVEVRSRSWLLAFLGGLACYHVMVLPAVFVLGPVLADAEYDGASSWAVVMAGFGVGCIVGDLLLLRWHPKRALRMSALMLVGASCQAVIIGSGTSTWAIALLEFGAGICVTVMFTLWETSLQEHIPNHALSRVASYDYMTSAGLIPLGTLVAGGLSSLLGLHTALVTMSMAGVAVSLAVIAVPAVRQLPRLTPPDHSAESALEHTSAALDRSRESLTAPRN